MAITSSSCRLRSSLLKWAWLAVRVKSAELKTKTTYRRRRPGSGSWGREWRPSCSCHPVLAASSRLRRPSSCPRSSLLKRARLVRSTSWPLPTFDAGQGLVVGVVGGGLLVLVLRRLRLLLAPFFALLVVAKTVALECDVSC